MSTRYNNGSHYENHERAAELHDVAAHAHRAGEQNGKQEYLTGHEHSRQAIESAEETRWFDRTDTVGHGIFAFGHRDIATLAHRLWVARGCPEGSPDEDWHNATEELRFRAYSR